MVRRLKSDLRYFGEKFPERVVDPIRIDGLPSDTPELVLSRKARGIRRGHPCPHGKSPAAGSWLCAAHLRRLAAATSLVNRRLREDLGSSSQGGSSRRCRWIGGRSRRIRLAVSHR